MNAHLQLYTHEFDHNKVWLSWTVFTANLPATMTFKYFHSTSSAVSAQPAMTLN